MFHPAHIPAVTLLGLALVAAAGCRMEPPPRRAVVPAAPPRFSSKVEPAAARAVRALASDDFTERSRAADVLVEMGDEALLALGEAGDLEVAAHGRVAVSATAPVVAAILSAVGAERLTEVHLVASAPNVRRAAAREIGRRGSLDAAPALIARLDDPDDGVRRTALDSLRLLAAPHDVGLVEPSPDGTGSLRGEAARWRDWWAREGSLLAAAPQAK